VSSRPAWATQQDWFQITRIKSEGGGEGPGCSGERGGRVGLRDPIFTDHSFSPPPGAKPGVPRVSGKGFHVNNSKMFTAY
jgi:hypothetical protein